jgi:hypothetical protein
MALAEGLIEEIAAGLCRFSYLRVIARALPRGWSAMRNKPGTLNSSSCGPETGFSSVCQCGLGMSSNGESLVIVWLKVVPVLRPSKRADSHQ